MAQRFAGNAFGSWRRFPGRTLRRDKRGEAFVASIEPGPDEQHSRPPRAELMFSTISGGQWTRSRCLADTFEGPPDWQGSMRGRHVQSADRGRGRIRFIPLVPSVAVLKTTMLGVDRRIPGSRRRERFFVQNEPEAQKTGARVCRRRYVLCVFRAPQLFPWRTIGKRNIKSCRSESLGFSV